MPIKDITPQGIQCILCSDLGHSMRYSCHCTNGNESESTSTRSDNSDNLCRRPLVETKTRAGIDLNRRTTVIQHRIVYDLAQQRTPTHRARVGDRLHATLFQRGGGSAEDMSSDGEENLGVAVAVANDVQPFVDTNTNKTKCIIVPLELSSINYRTFDRAR